MQKNTISPAVLAGAIALLTPYFEGLTAEKLVKALAAALAPQPAAEKEETLLTKKEVAKKYGCSEMTVHRLIQEGKLPARHISKRLVRIPSKSIMYL